MLADLLFPKKCLACGRGGNYLCKVCLEKQKFQKQRCVACEKPSIDGLTHFKCKRKLMLDGAVSVWRYDGVVRKALIGLKYRFAYEIAKELSHALTYYLRNNFTALPVQAILVPVPLHRSRENWRGFNQSQEIGKLIAQKMNWKFIPDLLIRAEKTIPQAGLSRSERIVNLKNVFVLNEKYKTILRAWPIIIFDDVSTTGTTLKEAGKVLKRARFTKVWGLTVAR